MKVIIFGARGFIGTAVCGEMTAAGHQVFDADDGTEQRVNLLNRVEIEKYLTRVKPDAIISCAGIVSPEGNFSHNATFTENILSAVRNTGILLKGIIISGSASEYGNVVELPVAEITELNGDSEYALSKVAEEQIAMSFAEAENLPVIVARIFNPIGVRMKGRFLIPGLQTQIAMIKSGESDTIQISRLDSMRDYIAVQDIASAFRSLLEGSPKYRVYNVGSGISTKNSEILDLLIQNSKLSDEYTIIETSQDKEPLLACQADISRISKEFGWKPIRTLEDTVKEILS